MSEEKIDRLQQEVATLRSKVRELGGYPDSVEVFCKRVLKKGDRLASTAHLYGHCVRWCLSIDVEPPSSIAIVGRRLKAAGFEGARSREGRSYKRAWLVSKEWSAD